MLEMRIAFPHVHALIGENHSFRVSICYLLLLKEFRGHQGILNPKGTDFSSYFQLDKEVIFSQHEPERECDAENNEKSVEEELAGDVLQKEIPKKYYPKRCKAATCRELRNFHPYENRKKRNQHYLTE